MSLGEITGWAALALSVLLGVLLSMQSRRISVLERRLRSLLKGAGAGADRMSLGDLVASQADRLATARAETQDLRAEVHNLEIAMARSVQHVGLVRYNPFEEAGGDQSFALALLDRLGNGVVISSLHGRTATRFYAKAVKDGTPAMSLSDEEARALKQAMEVA
jgi:hypothetical protein